MGEPGPSSRIDNFERIERDYDTDDENDPVVEEYPIIHATELQDRLYLLQYPYTQEQAQGHRSAINGNVQEQNEMNISSDEDEEQDSKSNILPITRKNPFKISKCRFRPNNEQISLKININKDASNFDTGRAELIAKQVDGSLPNKNSKSVSFENGIVDKVFLKSEKVINNSENYVVAAFNGKEVHLTSIKDIIRLKPDFGYLYQGLKKKKEITKNSNVDGGDDLKDQGPSKAQQVTVKMKKAQDPEKKSIQVPSYLVLEEKRNEEPWIDCTWNDEETEISQVKRAKLISSNLEPVQTEFVKDSEYLRQVIPEDQENIPLKPTLPSHILSMQALSGLPLHEQCKQLLMKVKIIQFNQIALLLAVKGITTDALLKAIQKVAVLVKGNWVVKSEILYPDDTVSAISGVPAELMCRARDYLLYLFTKHQYVQRKKLSSLLRIPAEELEQIFSGVSKRTHNKGWELSQLTDYDFLNKYSDLAQRQNLFWEHRIESLSSFLNQQSRVRRKSKSVSESDAGGGKVRTSSISCSDNESGTESKGISPVMAKKLIPSLN